jgi:hypothetical protein
MVSCLVFLIQEFEPRLRRSGRICSCSPTTPSPRTFACRAQWHRITSTRMSTSFSLRLTEDCDVCRTCQVKPSRFKEHPVHHRTLRQTVPACSLREFSLSVNTTSWVDEPGSGSWTDRPCHDCLTCSGDEPPQRTIRPRRCW